MDTPDFSTTTKRQHIKRVDEVKAFLWKNPGATAGEIIAATGMRYSNISVLLKAGHIYRERPAGSKVGRYHVGKV